MEKRSDGSELSAATLVTSLKAFAASEMTSPSIAAELLDLAARIERGDELLGFTVDDVHRAADIWENSHPGESYVELAHRAQQLESGAAPLLARAVRIELLRR